jgi:enoyl-[acyl-carrier protein] reductase I
MTKTDADKNTSNGLMAGKRGLIMGVANNHSIAWGIAEACHNAGAELAFSYQAGPLGRRATSLGETLGSELFVECSVDVPGDIDNLFDVIEKEWGSIDFVVHALAFSDRNELNGHYVDTTRDNFINTMVISCFSFTEVAKRAAQLMSNGGSMITLSYSGSTRVVPRYNVMGVAKAALEASVRYLAADLGPRGIRVNTLSPGPMRTMAGAAIADGRTIFKYMEKIAPLGRNPLLEEVGASAVYLLSDAAGGVTGQNLLVDCGASSVAMPRPEDIADTE